MSKLKGLSREFNETIDEVTHLTEVKDIQKEILDTKETIMKEGKDLDDFIDLKNKKILNKEKKNDK